MGIQNGRVEAATKAEFDISTLTGTFQALNGSGFSDAIKILKIYNPSTTVSIELSLDGVVAHDFIPPRGTMIIDFQANGETAPNSGVSILNVSKAQIIYGRTAPNPTYLQIVGYL